MNFEFIIGADDMRNLCTWVDAHPTQYTLTRGATLETRCSLVLGACYVNQPNRNQNTKSSTKAEVFGASNYPANNMDKNILRCARVSDIAEHS
jgi:hypothetical protein